MPSKPALGGDGDAPPPRPPAREAEASEAERISAHVEGSGTSDRSDVTWIGEGDVQVKAERESPSEILHRSGFGDRLK
jgi:hypothetical protein